MIEYDSEPHRTCGSTNEKSRTDTTNNFDSNPENRDREDRSASAETDPVLIPDGGETIREYREIERTEDEIRKYSADGTLYAYRDGDEHVVVSRGNEPGDKWEKRVPATRKDVTAGESLWTIPDNWIPKICISGTEENEYRVYTIPESGDDIAVSIPNDCHLVDATYDIKFIGKFNVEIENNLYRSVLRDTISASETRDDISPAVTKALQAVDSHWETFTRAFLENHTPVESEWYGQKKPDYKDVTLDGLAFDSWEETFGVTEIVMEICDVDKDLAAEVSELLIETNVLSARTEVKGSIHDQ